MDIFAHAMFGGAVAKGLKEKGIRHAPTIEWAMFWGAFPDLFAFTITFVTRIFGSGSAQSIMIHGMPMSKYLYQYSHSLVIIAAIFIVFRLVMKRWPLVLLGWPLHILFDMPLHSPDFYPTPFLFPISDWHLPFGIPWSTPWIWTTTWIVILVIYLGFAIYDRRKKNS